MTDRVAFERYVEQLALRHFVARELLGGGVPPRELWPNIALPLRLADLARTHFGRPASISQGGAYRDLERNRQAGGARLSQHLAFMALDVTIDGVSGREVAAFFRSMRGKVVELQVQARRVRHVTPWGPVPFAELETWDERHGPRSRVVFAGGVGSYSTFAHVDGRGINSTWQGR